MTTNFFAFNIAATAYLVLGSLHEESRLRRAYVHDYVDYLNNGTPFYLPWVDRSPFVRTETVVPTARNVD